MAIVEIKNLTFTYPDNPAPTLKDVTVSFPTNEWTTIIGHNGSGKSTLARLIDGLLPATEGQILVDGMEVNEQNIADVHQKIGFVFQNPENQFVGTTVADDVAFGLENHQVPRDQMDFRIKQALNDVDMLDYAEKEPGLLSGGQKQRVAIAGVLSLRPRILIFDEATSMLDPQARQSILKLLQHLKVEKGFTIIAISHDPVEALAGDNVAIIDQSSLVAFGKKAEILGDETLLKEHHLGLPFAMRLKDQLKNNGLVVPDGYQSEEELAKWIAQQSHFRK